MIPAVACFTTVGRPWYLPGALLLVAGALLLAGTRRGDSAAALDNQHWRVGLLVVCGAYYVLLGATALGLAGVLVVIGVGVIHHADPSASIRQPR